MFVVAGDLFNVGTEPNAVAVASDALQLGIEDGEVSDVPQVASFGRGAPEQGLESPGRWR